VLIMTYIKGERVRFTMNNLGVTRQPYDGRMVPDISINAGDIGAYVEPFKYDMGEEGWHIVAVQPMINTTMYVPVHESMIELVS